MKVVVFFLRKLSETGAVYDWDESIFGWSENMEHYVEDSDEVDENIFVNLAGLMAQRQVQDSPIYDHLKEG